MEQVLRLNVSASNLLLESRIEELCDASANSFMRTNMDDQQEAEEMAKKSGVQIICYEYGDERTVEKARTGYSHMLTNFFPTSHSQPVVLVGIYGDSTEIESMSITAGPQPMLKNYKTDPLCRAQESRESGGGSPVSYTHLTLPTTPYV